MIFLFLSVVAVCMAGLLAFRMHIAVQPQVTRADYETLLTEVRTLRGRLDKLNLSRT